MKPSSISITQERLTWKLENSFADLLKMSAKLDWLMIAGCQTEDRLFDYFLAFFLKPVIKPFAWSSISSVSVIILYWSTKCQLNFVMCTLVWLL